MLYVHLIIKYTLIYCLVFHQCSSMMREKPWWTILLLLPSLPCTNICQLRNHPEYCSDSSIVFKTLYRISCCCLFSSSSSFGTHLELIWYRDGGISIGKCWGHIQMLMPTLKQEHRPLAHVYRGTLVTITIPHNARLYYGLDSILCANLAALLHPLKDFALIDRLILLYRRAFRP